MLFFSSPALAAEKKDYEKTLSLGIDIQRLSFTNSKVEGVEIGFDSATVPVIRLDYRPLQNWALRLSASAFETDIEAGSDERFEHYGAFSQKTFSATLLYMTQTSERSPFRMFIGGGLSYHQNDIERNNQSEAIEDFFALNRTLSDIDDSVGMHGTLGFKYRFSDHLLVNASLTLSATDAKVNVTYPDTTVRESNLSLNAISIGTGLEYQF